MEFKAINENKNKNGIYLLRECIFDSRDNIIDVINDNIINFKKENALIILDRNTLNKLIEMCDEHKALINKGVIYFNEKQEKLEYRYNSEADDYVISFIKFNEIEYRGATFTTDFCLVSLKSNVVNSKVR